MQKSKNITEISVPDFKQKIFFERKSKYCLLIPLLNEGKRYISQVNKMMQNKIFEKLDVVICDAGSVDGTTEYTFLEESGHRALLVRQGKGRYSTDIRMGYAWALEQGYEGFITVDGNDKDDTSAIDLFLEKLEAGYDYIQGSRFVAGGKGINTPIVRHVALKLINEPIMTLCAHRHLTDTTNGFRAYSKRFLTDQRVLPFRDVFWGYELIYYLPVRACRLAFKICEVPVTRSYPDNGVVPSKVGGIKGNIYQLSILHHMIWKHYNPESKYIFKER